MYGENLPRENGLLSNILFSFVEFLKSIWNQYSCGDARYAISDPFIVSVERITAMFGGPLCFVLLYSIVFKRAYRHVLAVFLCTMQLYGVTLYFMTEHLENYKHVQLNSFKCYWFYYWFFNLLWVAVPAVFLVQSILHIVQTYQKLERSEGARREKEPNKLEFFVKLFCFANLLGMSLVVFGALGGHYLDDFLASSTKH